MLATLDYLIHGLGFKLPGSLGDVSIDSIPAGLGALKAVPAAGWAQILLFAGALEYFAPQVGQATPPPQPCMARDG